MINARGETIACKPSFRSAFGAPLFDTGGRVLRMERWRQAGTPSSQRLGEETASLCTLGTQRAATAITAGIRAT